MRPIRGVRHNMIISRVETEESQCRDVRRVWECNRDVWRGRHNAAQTGVTGDCFVGTVSVSLRTMTSSWSSSHSRITLYSILCWILDHLLDYIFRVCVCIYFTRYKRSFSGINWVQIYKVYQWDHGHIHTQRPVCLSSNKLFTAPALYVSCPGCCGSSDHSLSIHRPPALGPSLICSASCSCRTMRHFLTSTQLGLYTP